MRNKLGGFEFEDKESVARAKDADLVTLPKKLQNGINCSNCTFVEILDKKEGIGFCKHKEVLLPVTKEMCCKYQDTPGMIRQWEKK